ncbi:helix-turn-helix domain-containing protein (plasmid) [Arsenicicoccus dermatophilus]|uniref:helix-turn-helix domain-containing protein n=1 Tax=Arsenicicoccus dermatophilus TaxID=1076331 RepID=UPI003917113B
MRATRQQINTTDPVADRITLYVLVVLAEAERALIVERTRAVLAAARAAGRRGGRPTVMTPDRLRIACQLVADGESIAAAARVIGVSRPTLSRHLRM